MLKGVDVIGLGIGVAQFLQLVGDLVVRGRNSLVHERVEPRPYRTGTLQDRGQMLPAQFSLALPLCRRRIGLPFLPDFAGLANFGGKIRAPRRLAGWGVQAWVAQLVAFRPASPGQQPTGRT